MDIENILVMLKRCCMYFLWELFIMLGFARWCHLSSPMKTIINCNGNKTWRKQTRPMSWITLEKYHISSFHYCIMWEETGVRTRRKPHVHKDSFAQKDQEANLRLSSWEATTLTTTPLLFFSSINVSFCFRVHFVTWIATIFLWLGRKADKAPTPCWKSIFYLKVTGLYQF